MAWQPPAQARLTGTARNQHLPDEPLTPCVTGDRCPLVASCSAVIQVAREMGRAVHCSAITIITIEVAED
jgi:hypothetical protein